ncbi:hypothetical protein GC101_17255 [Paenibacillus sp. LMG 31459]|uniref:Uncharacterized protein n=1 Tax=Paenibacillus phytohabitans TaxID=2654978 RepID=A0ABX1YLQ7_9BACL|nr:hypothetical protein [Paenibacillus phytohabitans]NOU80614.1 hypothetical protein [Paenibacillus phytohabitans]
MKLTHEQINYMLDTYGDLKGTVLKRRNDLDEIAEMFDWNPEDGDYPPHAMYLDEIRKILQELDTMEKFWVEEYKLGFLEEDGNVTSRGGQLFYEELIQKGNKDDCSVVTKILIKNLLNSNLEESDKEHQIQLIKQAAESICNSK